MKTMPDRAPALVEIRFWRQVRKTETCWVWTGALKDGYGRLSEGGLVARTGRLLDYTKESDA